MNSSEKISPEWSLRIFTGLMYLYSGQDLLRHPTAWLWAIPHWLKQIISSVIPLITYLQIQGVVEIAIALVFLAWFLKPKIIKYAALLSTLEMAAILILAFTPFSETNFSFTFRDVGLLGGSFALFLILREGRGRVPQ